MRLTKKYLNEALDYDPLTGKLIWSYNRPRNHFKDDGRFYFYLNHHAGNEAGSVRAEKKGNSTYKRHVVNLGGKQFSVSRIIWYWVTGSWPAHQIDHINGNSLDHRWSNLRDVTPRLNSNNLKRYRTNSSGVCGVHRMTDGRYRAQASIKQPCGKFGKKNLGTFKDRFDAVCARKSWEAAQGYTSDSHGKR
ncbi:HNH endonuclease [Marinobacter confluentis]|uniref:HNH endonuclease n=1 Tax=Marinobacter confluentis TaxID=1697557 RepID=A0A4Z1C260_9GAMM|nr:HNH endonuclease [Marinobacter confluentis]